MNAPQPRDQIGNGLTDAEEEKVYAYLLHRRPSRVTGISLSERARAELRELIGQHLRQTIYEERGDKEETNP